MSGVEYASDFHGYVNGWRNSDSTDGGIGGRIVINQICKVQYRTANTRKSIDPCVGVVDTCPSLIGWYHSRATTYRIIVAIQAGRFYECTINT